MVKLLLVALVTFSIPHNSLEQRFSSFNSVTHHLSPSCLCAGWQKEQLKGKSHAGGVENVFVAGLLLLIVEEEEVIP